MGPNGTVTSIGKPTQRLYSINVIFFWQEIEEPAAIRRVTVSHAAISQNPTTHLAWNTAVYSA